MLIKVSDHVCASWQWARLTKGFTPELSVFWGIPTFMPMASYRRMHNRLTKHRLYMLTTALQSKTPLPQDSLSTRFVPTGIIQHDILVLAQRLIKEEGVYYRHCTLVAYIHVLLFFCRWYRSCSLRIFPTVALIYAGSRQLAYSHRRIGGSCRWLVGCVGRWRIPIASSNEFL